MSRSPLPTVIIVLAAAALVVAPLTSQTPRPRPLALPLAKERIKQIAARGDVDLLVLDFDRNYSSFEQQVLFLGEVAGARVPIVVMTDDLRRSTTTEFLLRGAHDCVGKPPSLPEFEVVMRRAHERALLERELEQMRVQEAARHCDQLIGASGRSQVVYDLVRRVASLSATVLITDRT